MFMPEPHQDVVEEAQRIVSAAAEAGVKLRLLGGTAVRCHCPSTSAGAVLARAIKDIDLIGLGRDSGRIKQLFISLGYTPHKHFNAVHGRHRLMFQDLDQHRDVDVFLDEFIMCHTFDFRKRLVLDENSFTLTPTDLLITKLQVVELNERDIKDILALVRDHELDGSIDGRDAIDVHHLARLCSGNWGVEKTFLSTLIWVQSEVGRYPFDPRSAEVIRQRLAGLAESIIGQPKTLRWKLRARIGERYPYYDLPEKPQGR